MASDYIEIQNDTTVAIRKKPTGNGVRLEIRSPRDERAILLDAIALETLSWQPTGALYRALGKSNGREATGVPDSRSGHDGSPNEVIHITNEFTSVAVRCFDSLLVLESKVLGYTNSLSADELEILTEQDYGIFSEFLETNPFGPDISPDPFD